MDTTTGMLLLNSGVGSITELSLSIVKLPSNCGIIETSCWGELISGEGCGGNTDSPPFTSFPDTD